MAGMMAGRVALVTGATSGIRRATALNLRNKADITDAVQLIVNDAPTRQGLPPAKPGKASIIMHF